jgi:hypothetical protein
VVGVVFVSPVAQLWYLGFSKPNSRELFLSEVTHRGERHFLISVNLAREMDKLDVR